MLKLKLNSNDLPTLKQVIDDCTIEVRDMDIKNLIAATMIEISEKLHKKSFWLDKKVTITLTPAQAIAFKIHFSRIELVAMPYENTLIRNLVAQVDQKLINGLKL